MIEEVVQPSIAGGRTAIIVGQLLVARLGAFVLEDLELGRTYFRGRPALDHLPGHLRMEFDAIDPIAIAEGLAREGVIFGEMHGVTSGISKVSECH